MKASLLILVGWLMMTGCAGVKAWTVPTDLYSGSAADMVRDAAEAGKLSDLMILAEDQLFDTDEARFAEFLKAALASGKLSESETSTAEWMLHGVCELNSPGTRAANFRFEMPDGREYTLWDYLPGRPLVLIIYDPDCSSCKATLGALSELSDEIDVLAVCVEVTAQRWTETRDMLPQKWHKGYDRSDILYNDDYVIRSMPGIYLLDGERNVIMKHPKIELLLEKLKK